MTPQREHERRLYVTWRERKFGAHHHFMDYTDSKMFAAFRAGYAVGVAIDENAALASLPLNDGAGNGAGVDDKREG